MNVKKLFQIIFIVVFVVGLAPEGYTNASQSLASTDPTSLPPSSAVPAPTNGPKPTIHLSVNHGYVGQDILVSGSVPSSAYTGVRVSWVISDTTYTTAVVNRDATLAYQATTGVPHTLDTGPAKICAALTGIATAEYACQDFTLDTPPNGSVSGTVPVAALSNGAAGQAEAPTAGTVNLLDRAGSILYSGAIGGNGAFNIPDVTPGIYQIAVTGNVSQLVGSGTVTVNPAVVTEIALPAGIFSFDPVTGQPCIGNFAAQVSAVHNTTTTSNYLLQISYLSSLYTFGSQYNSTPHDYDFGLYINGVSVSVPFSSYLQVTSGATVSEVQYHVKLPNGTITQIGSSSDAGSHYGITYDVGGLPAGDTQLIVSPVVNSVRQCPSLYKIRVMSDPMKDPILQPGAVTTWDSSHSRYNFQGTLVNVGNLLPLIDPTPPPSLPLIGTLTNELSAGLDISGNITLDGAIHIQVMKAEAFAKLFSIQVFDDKVDLLKQGSGTTTINPNKPLDSSIGFGPATLWQDGISTTVFKGVVASFWGIVSIDASVSVGLTGTLTINGTIYPFQPNLDVTLTPTIIPSLSISIWVDLLLGIASAGATATAAVGFGLPLRVNTNDPNHPEMVWIDTPCFSLKVSLAVWARVNLLFWSQTWNIGSWDLVNFSDPSGCNGLAAAIKSLDPNAVIAPPRAMASPAVATNAAGEALSVYIVDTSPNQQQPTPKVAASFWDSGSQTWGTPSYLTDGNHAVQDPVSAFIGPGNTPIVVWTETNLTLAQEQTMGNDINSYLQKQEIFYTTWNGMAWNTPTQLTNNMVPDGRASIAGDATGATLAWVENTGGLTSTTQKMRIAVTEWNAASNTFDAFTLLNGNSMGDAMNVQPSAARIESPFGTTERAVAWTVDVDGNVSTNSDRHLVVARWSATGGWSSPTFDLTSQLPSGAESPSLSFDPSTGLAHMAFLVRGVDADGVSDTGIGNRAILWSADANVDTLWSGVPVKDRNLTIYAEKPVLQISGTGERLLVFRRFGTPGTNAALGQLALSQGLGSGGYSSPLYLTDAPVNHWQQSFAINPSSGDAMILNVNRSTILAAQAASLESATNTPVSTSKTLALTAGNDTVESFNVSSSADLALDPSLQLSAQHAPSGDTVVVTASLRNLGRGAAVSNAAGLISVCFYSGVSPTGTQLGCDDLPAGTTLTYTASVPLAFNIVSNRSAQPVYAQVFSNGFNGNPANDIATGALGAIPAPRLTSVSEDKRYLENALSVRWIPPLVPGVLGFRVLRSINSGASYELVGETSSSYLPDLQLNRGVNYCYVVQAYDSAGTLSSFSNQICGKVPLLSLYIPITRK